MYWDFWQVSLKVTPIFLAQALKYLRHDTEEWHMETKELSSILIAAGWRTWTGILIRVDLQILSRIKHMSPSGPASAELEAELLIWQEASWSLKKQRNFWLPRTSDPWGKERKSSGNNAWLFPNFAVIYLYKTPGINDKIIKRG